VSEFAEVADYLLPEGVSRSAIFAHRICATPLATALQRPKSTFQSRRNRLFTRRRARHARGNRLLTPPLPQGNAAAGARAEK
jgi:hypothetical protein